MKKIVSLIIMLMVIIASANAVAASSFSLTATPDKNQIKPGENITISLEVGDISLGENGMNTLEGMIKFDSNIFEVITEDSAVGQNNWSASINAETDNENYGKFFFNKTSAGITTGQVIGSITLKVKSDVAQSTPTIVTISNITSNDGDNLVTVEDKVISLNVQVEEENPDTNTTLETNEIPEMNIVSNQLDETNVVGNQAINKVDNTTNNQKLPQTGENIVIGTAIIAVGALAIYFYIRAYKMK